MEAVILSLGILKSNQNIMMNLTIETEGQQTRAEIMAAYDKAMEASNIKTFVSMLDMATNKSIIVGLSGSHVWVSEKATGKRLAIITNLFN